MKVFSKKKKAVRQLTRAERSRKYELELMFDQKITNDFVFKVDSQGRFIPLKDKDRSYRVGFITGSKNGK